METIPSKIKQNLNDLFDFDKLAEQEKESLVNSYFDALIILYFKTEKVEEEDEILDIFQTVIKKDFKFDNTKDDEELLTKMKQIVAKFILTPPEGEEEKEEGGGEEKKTSEPVKQQVDVPEPTKPVAVNQSGKSLFGYFNNNVGKKTRRAQQTNESN